MAVETIPPQHEFPWPNFLTLAADGIMNVAHSPTTVKFYLFRFEPSFTNASRFQQQPTAQVVMPIDGMIATAALFEKAIKRWVAMGVVSQERIDEIRKTVPEPPY